MIPIIPVLLACLLGCLAGIVTGLSPGIHINLVSVLVVALAPALLQYFPLLGLACFIITMSVTHTFLDTIPSIFLGAPDDATALGVLPGHRYLLKGWGLMAVKLSVIGSLVAVVLSVVLFPLFVLIIRFSYPFFQAVMGWLLLAIILYMVLRDRLRWWAALVFILSGVLGLVVLNIPGLKNPLFPLLSGLFGIATLLFSLNETSTIPPQQESPDIKVKTGVAVKALSAGQISGFLTAMLPGVGPSMAAVLSLQVFKDLGDHGYMLLQGSINTVNFVLSLAALLVLDKARNGSIIAVQQLLESITLGHIMVFLAVTVLSAGIALLLTLWFARIFCRLVSLVNYRVLVLTIIIFIIVLTPILSGWTGLLILLTSTSVGLIPATVKCARVHAMGCLLLPVLLYFLGG
ncbi:MAG: tripartite tricarboxylate transporter permease [Candidatus Woesearchaeota archaeon]